MKAKTVKRICFYLVLGAACVMGWSATAAGSGDSPPVGKIVALRGKALAHRNDAEPRPLALKSPVYIEETIETKAGRLQIMFTDNTLITLGRNSRVVLETYHWKPGDRNPGCTPV